MSSAARYIPRAPRFVFRPQDQKLMRFAEMDTRGVTAIATVRDLSTTGISFVTTPDQELVEGEMLKVEFTLPSGEKERTQVAWFANVVRVEKKSEWDPQLGERPYVIIALSFHRIPSTLIATISRSLLPHLQSSEENTFDIDRASAIQTLTFFALTATLALCLMAMAMPSTVWFKLIH